MDDARDIDWRIGTMGFSYADWRGVFYPQTLKPAEFLAFYAKQLNALELDTTFHATPPRERFRKWADATTAGFRFAVKTPRTVTHDGVVSDAGPLMREFLSVASELGDRLGPILIQYPPTLTARVWPQLQRFLDTLPPGFRYAVEFRHDSWRTEAVAAGLVARNIALVNAQYDTPPLEPVFTTDFAYIRLVGRHGRFEPMNHERFDPTSDLTWWHERLIRSGRKTIYLMVNNDFAGYSIGTSDRIHRLIGRPVETPAQRMGTLF